MKIVLDHPTDTTTSTSVELRAPSISGARVQWGHVIGFVALAYVLAWGAAVALVPHLLRYLSADQTPSKFRAPAIVVVVMYAPAIAAVIMRRFVSKEGLRTSLGPIRHRLRYFAVALVAPALAVGLIISAAVGFGGGHFEPGANIFVLVLVVAVNAIVVNSFLAFGEEYGWRGYLLPKLLPLGEIRAGVIVGVIWGFWHAPLLIAGLNYPHVDPLVAVALFIPTGVVMSLLFTRLYVASGGSVLVVSLLHGSLNAYGDRLADAKHLVGDTVVVATGGVISIGVFAVLATVVYGLHGRRRRASAPAS
jgi:membrane protease YdiL (CAAX protease family)